jgi:hypothetical protein
MTNVFTNANKVSPGFAGFRGKWVVVNFVVDFFPPVETEEWADIMGGTREAGHRDIAVHTANGMVKQEAGIE